MECENAELSARDACWLVGSGLGGPGNAFHILPHDRPGFGGTCFCRRSEYGEGSPKPLRHLYLSFWLRQCLCCRSRLRQRRRPVLRFVRAAPRVRVASRVITKGKDRLSWRPLSIKAPCLCPVFLHLHIQMQVGSRDREADAYSVRLCRLEPAARAKVLT